MVGHRHHDRPLETRHKWFIKRMYNVNPLSQIHSSLVSFFPAGTRRNDSVFTTSKRRHRRRFDVMKTLSLRHYFVMSPLGSGDFNWWGNYSYNDVYRVGRGIWRLHLREGTTNATGSGYVPLFPLLQQAPDTRTFIHFIQAIWLVTHSLLFASSDHAHNLTDVWAVTMTRARGKFPKDRYSTTLPCSV